MAASAAVSFAGDEHGQVRPNEAATVAAWTMTSWTMTAWTMTA
jgi:hypothetical protein